MKTEVGRSDTSLPVWVLYFLADVRIVVIEVGDIKRATCLGRRGRGRAAGLEGGSPHSCAAAGRTHMPQGRCCRREVCPEEEVCCPPSHPT